MIRMIAEGAWYDVEDLVTKLNEKGISATLNGDGEVFFSKEAVQQLLGEEPS
jgi:hypothetical protein